MRDQQQEGRERLEASSRYFSILLRRFPDYADWLWGRKQLYRRFPLTELYQDLLAQGGVEHTDDWMSFAKILRRFKQRHFLRLAIRDLLQLDTLPETMSQLSDLAVVLLRTSLTFLWLRPSVWLSAPGDTAHWHKVCDHLRMSVLGLGKLGGHELNFVSDIDLLFLYETDMSDVAGTAQELLPRLCQNLARLFSDLIEGDRLFAVDFRLRPGGKDGEMVPSRAYAVHYYLLEGRSWERLALIKAAPVAGDIALGNLFLSEVQSFVFRRFLDFQAIDDIRVLRDRMLRETPREGVGAGFDVKLGQGGIREIEFLVQVFQLIYGGRQRNLRERNTLRSLLALQEANLLTEEVVGELSRAYVLLRRLEHWIQLDENRQTQQIPREPLARERLVRAMGYDTEDVLFRELEEETARVRTHFLSLFAPHDSAATPERAEEHGGQEGAPEWMEKLFGHEMGRVGWQVVGRDLSRMQRGGGTSSAVYHTMVNRVRRWGQAISKRPGLLRFLASPKARESQVFERSLRAVMGIPLIADLLTRTPGLIEGLTEGGGSLEEYELWRTKARDVLDGVHGMEEKLSWLRRVKNERLLAIALWDVASRPPVWEVERELSRLAHFFVDASYAMLCESLGVSPRSYPLAVGAMGRCGSAEMGYRSDLDILFIYAPEGGERVIPEATTRLIQRLVRILSLSLQEGPGYEVDMRLRPTGNYGPLVVTLPTWEEYYEGKADVWEIASLLRFRPIAGHLGLSETLAEKAAAICLKRRHPSEVWPRLCELKERMERERTRENTEMIHLKLGRGGLVEMELWCHGTIISTGERERFRLPVSTIEVLPTVVNRWGVDEREAREVVKAYTTLRQLSHRVDLLGKNTEEVGKEDVVVLKMLGLWRGSEDSEAGEEWREIQALRRVLRKRWEWVCGDEAW